MIGVVCSALAALTASLAARRQRRHQPIAAALWVALAYAVAAEAGSSAYAPRSTLVLWALAAVTSAWAYLDAWGQRGAWWPVMTIGAMLAGALLFGGRERWLLATWGPLAVSAACGVAGTVIWWRRIATYSEDAYQALRTVSDRIDPSLTSNVQRLTRLERIGVTEVTQRIALVLTASDAACLLFIPWPGVQVWQGRVSAIVVAGMQLYWYLKNRTATP